jgi:hypothetical protein
METQEFQTHLPIYWYSLVAKERSNCQAAMHELQIVLQSSYPQLPRLRLLELSSEEADHIPDYINNLKGGYVDPQMNQNPLLGQRFFAFCKGEESFVSAARLSNPDAEWGPAERGVFALAWEPGNKFLIWHEVLHLLYAQDCYDSKGRTTCGEDQCIMQYIPNSANCGESIRICGNNITQIIKNLGEQI